MTTQPVFHLDQLTITTPAGKRLVEQADMTLGASEVALLVGPSGSGKSTIIKLLGGLLDDRLGQWRIQGNMRHGGRAYDLARDRCDIGGLVFQNYALFDDLTAKENLNIALDHTSQPDSRMIHNIMDLLEDIEPDQTIAASSGGQRQRIAIARTLLANRPLLLFDEPNSGLDPFTAQRLGELIRDLCRRMGRPALIVAHHVDSLLPLVDRVYLLDTRARRLRQLPVERDAVEQALMGLGVRDEVDGRAQQQAPGAQSARQAWDSALAVHPRQRWFIGYLREYLWILWASPLMLLYMFSGAVIIGFVTLWFGFNYELLGDMVRSFVHDETLAGIGFVQANVAVPLIASILMVARNNAIITADLGNRVLSAQFLAMRNLHIPGRFYLTLAILANTLLGGLFLVVASLVLASWASLHTWQFLFPEQPVELWQENFFFSYHQDPEGFFRNMGWGFLKVLASTTGSAWLAISIGLARKESVIAVNYAIARSIVWGVTFTLAIHACITVAMY